PQSRGDANDWQPHEWVIASIQAAALPRTTAAQEAVAWRLMVHVEGVEPFSQYVTDRAFIATLRNAGCKVDATPLYPASVAAAPVDGGQITGWRNVDGISVFTVASH